MGFETNLAIIYITFIFSVIALVLIAFWPSIRRRKILKFSKQTIWSIFPYLLLLYFIWLILWSPILAYQTIPSTISGLFGIIIGFWLNESTRLIRKKKQAKQLLRAIMGELKYNLELASSMENDIEIADATFTVFKTNMWESFENRLEIMENFQLVVNLSILYHKLFNIANTIRYRSKEIADKGVDEVLPYVLEGEPLDGIRKLKKDIQNMISDIEKELA